ncbi:MAG: TPM domain-containing protein [Patescibacteria group bacterium]
MRRLVPDYAWLLGWFFLPAMVLAYMSPGAPQGFVSDFAGLLQPAERQALESELQNFTTRTGNEIAVVTVTDLGGDTIENFAVKLFEEWKIGKKGLDNGALILVSKEDREVRIEVGYGLEGTLTDAQSSWIINRVIVPAFKEDRYYDGLSGAVQKIISAVGGEALPEEKSGQGTTSSSLSVDWAWLIFFVPIWLASILGRSKSWWLGGVIGGIMGVIFGFVWGFVWLGAGALAILVPLGLFFDFLVSRSYSKARTSGHYPWWIGGRGPGGGGGGGFGGFGGGSSGGGGASGRW